MMKNKYIVPMTVVYDIIGNNLLSASSLEIKSDEYASGTGEVESRGDFSNSSIWENEW